jgi:hypothetical protein
MLGDMLAYTGGIEITKQLTEAEVIFFILFVYYTPYEVPPHPDHL